MSETSSDRTAAVANPNDAEKSAHPRAGSALHGNDGDSTPRDSSPAPGHGKHKMTHEEKEAARTGWRAEVQEIPKQVGHPLM